MADGTDIEWATHPVTGKGATWNPIVGCAIESPGCIHCYAMKLAGSRLRSTPSRQGLTKPSKNGPVWTGEVRFVEEWLTQPLHWRAPRGIFVCAHGDLFAPGVPDEWIDKVFAVMALAPQHIFMVLTKRPARMRQYLTKIDVELDVDTARRLADAWPERRRVPEGGITFPLPNVWLGTSVEDQMRAVERIPALLETPAAKRFISAEPLLEAIDLTTLCDGWKFIDALGGLYYTDPPEDQPGVSRKVPGLDWVIAGFESGSLARVAHGAPDIARSLRDQCASAGVPFFFKQWGSWAFAPEGMNYQEAMSWGRQERHSLSQRSEGWGGSGGLPTRYEQFSDGRTAFFTTKAKAGRLLDGVEHNAMPAVT